MTENQIIQQFIVSINELIKSDFSKYEGIKYVNETYVYSSKGVKIIDGAITRNNEIVGIFEFKSQTKQHHTYEVWEGLKDLNLSFKYLVISNGIYFKILDTDTDKIYDASSIPELLDILLILPSESEIDRVKAQIADVFIDCANEFFNEMPVVLNHLTKTKIVENLLISDGGYYYLSDDINDLSNFENIFFSNFFEDLKPDELFFRYTTLDTVFATIDKKSIRLNGLIGDE